MRRRLGAEPILARDLRSQVRFLVEEPAQPLSDSLRSIARLTGASLLFDPAAVGGRVSRPVFGHFSAMEAVRRALDGSNVLVAVLIDGVIIVRLAGRSGICGR